MKINNYSYQVLCFAICLFLLTGCENKNKELCISSDSDSPGFAYPIGGTFDRFGRQFGVYAKGTLSKLNYRLSVVKPFENGVEAISVDKTTEGIYDNFAAKGYFCWQFFDEENHLFPYMTMNNLGRAKLLNIGAGFYMHPEATIEKAAIGSGAESEISDIFLASADIFLDVPTRNKGAITSYLAYYYYDFEDGEHIISNTKGQLILQTQIFF